VARRQKVQWLLWGINLVGLGLGTEGMFKVCALPTAVAFLKLVAIGTFMSSACALGIEVFRSKNGLRPNFYTGSPCAFLALATIERLLPRVPSQQLIDHQQGLNIFMCLGSAGVALFVSLMPEDRFKPVNNQDNSAPTSIVDTTQFLLRKDEPR
jgi:hypothetical protein